MTHEVLRHMVAEGTIAEVARLEESFEIVDLSRFTT